MQTQILDLQEMILRNNRRSGTKMARKIKYFIVCPPIDIIGGFVLCLGSGIEDLYPWPLPTRKFGNCRWYQAGDCASQNVSRELLFGQRCRCAGRSSFEPFKIFCS